MSQSPRSGVAADVALATFLLCPAGGFVIGAATFLITGVGQSGPSDGEVLMVSLGGLVGLMFGISLGLFGGCVLAVIAALALVPYRGPRITRWIMRVAATTYVVAGLAYMLWSSLGFQLGERDTWQLLGPAGIGAWLLAPLAVGPYIAREERALRAHRTTSLGVDDTPSASSRPT